MRNTNACGFQKYLEQVKESLQSVTECIWSYWSQADWNTNS